MNVNTHQFVSSVKEVLERCRKPKDIWEVSTKSPNSKDLIYKCVSNTCLRSVQEVQVSDMGEAHEFSLKVEVSVQYHWWEAVHIHNGKRYASNTAILQWFHIQKGNAVPCYFTHRRRKWTCKEKDLKLTW